MPGLRVVLFASACLVSCRSSGQSEVPSTEVARLEAELHAVRERLAEAEARVQAEQARHERARGELQELSMRLEALETRRDAAPAQPVRRGQPDPNQRYRVDLDGAHVRGSDDALVTVVEWASFQCPFSARVQQTLRQLMEAFPGMVRIVFKHNPLPMHEQALPAALAAEAAGRQGKFWEMHDKIWDNQRALTNANFTKWAKQLRLDMTKFKRDLADPALADRVVEQQKQAERLQARGTPAFFINGRFLSGAQPFDAFSTLVDQELSKARALVAEGAAPAAVYDALMRGAIDP